MNVYLLWKKQHDEYVPENDANDVLIDIYTDPDKAEEDRTTLEKTLYESLNQTNSASKTVNAILGVDEFPVTEYYILEERETK